MKNKFFSLILSITLTVSFVGCTDNASKTNTNNPIPSPVSIENVSDKYYKVVLDYNSGVSHKEMGRLLGKEIKKKVPHFEKNLDGHLSQLCAAYNLSYSIEKEVVKKIIKNVDKDYIDELDGLASQLSGDDNSKPGDGKVSKDELYLINLFIDAAVPVRASDIPISCSAFSVYGSRSEDGKTITGRHLDWLITNDHYIEKLSAVVEYKHGDKSIYSIGPLGVNGVITGFNKDKVFGAIIASLTDKPCPESFNNIRSITFDLRYALENNKSLDTAAAYLSDKNNVYSYECNIFLSDPTTSKSLENDIRGTGTNIRRELRTDTSELNAGIAWDVKDSLATVNAFALKGNHDNMTNLLANTARWDSYKRLLNAKKSPLNIKDVKEILSFTNVKNGLPGNQDDGSLYNVASIQSIIFKPDELKLQVHFAPRNSLPEIKPEFLDIPVDFK